MRYVVPVQGMDSEDIDTFDRLKAKANTMQLEAMTKDLQAELKRR